MPAKAGLGTWRTLAVWKEKDTIKLPVDIMPLESKEATRSDS